MKRSKKLLSILSLAFLPSLFYSQEFFKTYSTVYDRTSRDIMRNAATGEYLIVGASNNSNPTDGDVYVMRTDANGTFLWDTVYGGNKPDYAYSMTDTDDGNYIVVGYSQSRPGGGGDFDIYMLKLAPSGRKLNEKWVDIGYKNEEARAIIRKGSDYYVIGTTGMASTSAKADMVLLKIDHDLTVVETHTYGGTNDDYGLAIADANDGGFIIAGQTLSEGAGMGDAYVVKLNSGLTPTWTKTFGDGYDEEVVGVAINSANNTAMLAIRDSIPGQATDGNIDVVLQKINISDGSVPAGFTEQRWFNGNDKDTPKTIRSVSTGGYIVGAISRSWWPGPQMWPIRIDDNGGVLWKYDYGDFQEHDHCHMIKEDYDGRFVMVGHQRLGGIMKVAFLKLSSQGTVGIKESGKVLAGIKAFPNPSNDGNISLSFTNPGEYNVEIVNVMGQQIGKNVVNLLQPGVYQLQLPSTGAGIYIVNIKSGEGTYTARLIVE